MRISPSFKFWLIAIFLILAFAIEKSENLKLRELAKSESSSGSALKSDGAKGKTKIYPFRKLEKKVDLKIDDDDDDDNDDEDEDDDDDKKDIPFMKVRKSAHEVKKRSNLKFSKLSQNVKKDLKDSKNDDDDDEDNDDDDDDDDEDLSWYQKAVNFVSEKFTGLKSQKNNVETGDDEDDDDDETEDENETEVAEIKEEDKSIFDEVVDIMNDFWATKAKKEQSKSDVDDDDEGEDDEDEDDDDMNDNKEEKDDDDDNDVNEKKVEKKSDNKIRISLNALVQTVFNRSPFNWFLDFDDDDDVDTFEDTVEDDINYQKLLDEEHDLMQKHVDKLTSEEQVNSGDDEAEKSEKPIARIEKQKRSRDEPHLSRKEFEKLLLNLPSFVPDYSKVKNAECQKHGEIFLRQLRGQRIWALQMMDATAKIPSGLLRGNTNQLGDFDLCTKISQKIKISESKTIKMKGKYCLANIDIATAVDELKLPVHLIQGRNFIRSTINDPSHFFPRYSTINWGLCLPSACTHQDADHILESFIGPYNSTGIKLHINVNEENCYVRQHFELIEIITNDWRVLVTILILLSVVAATIISSINDYISVPFLTNRDALWVKLLNCFSVKENLPKIFGSESNENEIPCINGLKALSMILILLSIKLISIGHVPYTNRNKVTEFFNSPLSIFLRTSFLYEDVFLLISGTLAALSFYDDVNILSKFAVAKKILVKALRVLIPTAFVLLFYAFIWENLGTGPQWPSIVEKNAELCKDNLWRNLLFIQNIYPLEDMCASHTYHLANYFQLLILTPLMVWSIQNKPTFGLGIYGALHGLSTAARFSSTVENRLSSVVFHGMKLSQLYRTFNMSITVALHRATPFLTGLALAMILKEYRNAKLPKGITIMGWISAIYGFFWCFYTPSNLTHKDYLYEPIGAAQYYAMAPLIWSLTISWIIYACSTDLSLTINKILSSRILKVFGNVSFSIYLNVFLIMFYFNGTLKSAEEFQVSSYIDRVELFFVIGFSILFAIVIDQPSKNIVKLIEAKSQGESSVKVAGQNGNHLQDNSAKEEEEEEIEDPFGDRDDDFVYRPKKKPSYYDDDYTSGQVEEEEVTVEEPKPQEEKRTSAKKWQWQILDEE